MRLLAVLAMLLSPLALGAADASCAPPGPVAERIGRADAVVWGTVTGFEGGLLPDPRAVVVRVQTVYKGAVPAQIVVRGGPEMPGTGPGRPGATSVDYSAQPGSSHTFYLKRDRAGFSTDACSGSHEGEPTPEELASLGAPRPPDRAAGGPQGGPDGWDGGLGRAIGAVVVLGVVAGTFLAFRGALAR